MAFIKFELCRFPLEGFCVANVAYGKMVMLSIRLKFFHFIRLELKTFLEFRWVF